MYKRRATSERKKHNNSDKMTTGKRKNPISSEPSMNVEEESQVSSKKRLKYEDVLALLEYKPEGKFENLYGCDAAQDEVLDIVAGFKRAIDGQANKSNRPVLICGSHGLGKTSIVEAAANHAKLKLIPVPLKTLVAQAGSNFKVVLEQLVHYSLSSQPAIVMIEDLQRLNDKEDSRDLLEWAIKRLLAKETKILIFCTTSSILDNSYGIAFSFTIQLKRPNSEARFKIMQSLRKENNNLRYLTDDCLKSLATMMPSFTAPDIINMLHIAETKSHGQPTLIHCEQAIEYAMQSFRQGTLLIGERPSVTWNDIGGLADVRRAFQNILEQIRCEDMNCKFAGIALYGPPGCGKTMVAQAMANEAGFNFISIKPTELVNKFLGETERNIRRVFSEAKEYEPCMIYFDEFDGLCGTRGNRDNVTGAIQTLLSEMDGFASRGKSIILASTNRLEDIDPAMKRPGRLTEQIFVGPPDVKARREILSVAASRLGVMFAEDVELNSWSEKTEHFTGAHLDHLVSKAKFAARLENSQAKIIHQKHLEHSFDVVNKSREN